MRYKHFTKQDRYEISILLSKGYSQKDIADVLGKNPSSVSREVRNNSVKGRYDPNKAQHKARVRRLYAKFEWKKIREHPWLEKYVQTRLISGWSPEKIAGRLKLENDHKEIVSFKTIYNYLTSPFGKKYRRFLKYKRPKKKLKQGKREHIKDRVFIESRPVVIDNRARIGDFEGDTMGKPRTGKETLVVLVDRKSRYLLAKKVSRLCYSIEGFKELLETVSVVKSLTLDNGVENARYQELKTNTYFCHPYSAWEKGSVENTIGLIRDYIPKKSRLESYSPEYISAIVQRLNNAPKKCLGFRTPNEIFYERNINTISLREGCT